MYLSQLEIFGFKSFAQKAIFKFDSGLTAIIGPNGCGKSNIVDAIRWVLGEQRPSVLRADRMENLIFNGTSTRKPLGYAEVSMTIENTRHILPSEFTEVKITRRLYRSGESEYLINNRKVRLLDIINLFADTGMGADAYSVIELKMVEQILSDNAEERRRLFEEAAGIKKYKYRRKSALRKLDTTRQELVRLNDVIAEVKKNVNSLARQVGKARRYHQYKDAIKQNEILLGHLKLTAYGSQLEPLKMEFDQVKKTTDTLGNTIITLEAQLETLQAQEAEMEQKYREIATILSQKDTRINELQNRQSLLAERQQSLENQIRVYQQDISNEENKIRQYREEIEALNKQIEQLKASKETAQNKYRAAANEVIQAEEVYQTIATKYQEYVQSNFNLVKEFNTAREELQKTEIEQRNLQQNIQKIENSIFNLQQSIQLKSQTVQEIEEKLQSLKKDQEIYDAEVEHLNREIEREDQNLKQLNAAISAKSTELEKIRNRRDFLGKLIDNYEGFSNSVQFIMHHKKQFRGLVDTLANLIDCQEEFKPALESFLSGISEYLIVEEVETARQILEDVRQKRKGRLTVVPIPLLNSNHHRSPRAPSLNGKSVPLKDVVIFKEDYQTLFNLLLQDVYIVENLEEAIELHQQYSEVTFITKKGEILSRWGTITGGSADSNFNVIGRKKEYAKLDQHFHQLENEIQTLQSRQIKSEHALEVLHKKREELHALQETNVTEINRLEKILGQQTFELERLKETLFLQEGEVSHLKSELTVLQEKARQLLPDIQKREKVLTDYQSQETALLQEKESAERQVKSLSEQSHRLQIEYLNFMNEEKNLSEKIKFLDRNIQLAQERISQQQNKIQENTEAIEQILVDRENNRKNLESLYQERDEIDHQKNEFEKEFQELKYHIQNLESDLKKKHRLWNQGKDRLQALELQMKELEVKTDSLREQLTQKYGAEALEIIPEKIEPHLTIQNLEQELERLRQKLEGLGDVNPLAIKEHEQEKQRLDFLQKQQADLLDAEQQLLETIHKLNKTARKQFTETFEKIRENFHRVFQEFFDGGEADLILVENKDPLEANIDISVKVKGKQLNTLSLLSAGEKTLVAISLLFSIYLVKPSPFCILDEVDAPLDDVNITQFTRALKRFSRDTQFIVVTHNKRTMEATQSLYGITMEEPGVSKVVSVRLD